jgi:hypothetical protein
MPDSMDDNFHNTKDKVKLLHNKTKFIQHNMHHTQMYAELNKALERKFVRACPRGLPASFQPMHQPVGNSYKFQLLPRPLLILPSPHFYGTKQKK